MNILNKIGIIGMLLCLLGKSLVIPVLLVKYEFTKDFIIENYCVNKDKPKLHCDGKCYLAKQLQAAEEQTKKNTADGFINYLIVLEVIPAREAQEFFEPHLIISVLQTLRNHSYLFPFTDSHLSRVFHPPK